MPKPRPRLSQPGKFNPGVIALNLKKGVSSERSYKHDPLQHDQDVFSDAEVMSRDLAAHLSTTGFESI